MKKNYKKLIGTIAAFAIAVSMPITAFAGSKDKNVHGYGTLHGSVNSNGHYVTSVDKNHDKAYLTISSTVQNKRGETLIKQKTKKSKRGKKSLTKNHKNIPSGAYALFGTHGVQGGRTYGSAAVYTYSRAYR